jgi:Coenzyme PQQ synthesis protein D (PqqD)
MRSLRFRPASSQVLSETLDGEAVVINLETGLYYALDPTATEIWDAARAGESRAAIATALASRYSAAPGEIEAAVDDLLAELEAEHLLVAIDGAEAAPFAPRALSSSGDAPAPFARPSLSRFDDIQELLLLDPIHEVDEGGWPEARRDGSGTSDRR